MNLSRHIVTAVADTLEFSGFIGIRHVRCSSTQTGIEVFLRERRYGGAERRVAHATPAGMLWSVSSDLPRGVLDALCRDCGCRWCSRGELHTWPEIV
jgi:hypothetical protein